MPPINTQSVIGFVKYGPGPFQDVNWQGGHFKVWPQQIAIVDILRRNRHEVRIFGPGIHTVDRQWFSDQETRLTILSTGQETFPLAGIFNHTIQVKPENKTLPISVTATIQFRLIDREDELKAAMDRLLERDPEKLGKLNETLKNRVQDAMEKVIMRSHLAILKGPRQGVAEEVKRQVASERYVRQELAIDVVGVEIQSIQVPTLPVPPPPVAPFIFYRGPLDLAPQCRVTTEGVFPELRFIVPREQIALVASENQPLRAKAYDMRQASLSDPQYEVIVLSLAKQELRLTTEATRYLEFNDGTEGMHPVKADIVLGYRISERHLNNITFDTAGNLLGMLQRETVDVCREIIQKAPARLLNSPLALTNYFRQGLAQYKRIEDIGLELLSIHIDAIIAPPNIRLEGLKSDGRTLVARTRLDALIDPSGERLQIPSNHVGLYLKDDSPRLLTAGSHQLSVMGTRQELDPNMEIKLVSLEEMSLEVTYTFSPRLIISTGMAALPITLKTTVFYQVDLSDPKDPDVLEAISHIRLKEESRNQWLEAKAISAIEAACQEQGPALLSKETAPLNKAIQAQLTGKLEDSGLRISHVAVTDIQHPQELYEIILSQHRHHLGWLQQIADERSKFLSQITDARSQQAYAQMVPSLSLPLLMQYGQPGDIQKLFDGFLKTAASGLDRNSGTEVATTLQSLMGLLTSGPGGTGMGPGSVPGQGFPQTATGPQTFDETGAIIDDHAQIIDSQFAGLTQMGGPAPTVTMPPMPTVIAPTQAPTSLPPAHAEPGIVESHVITPPPASGLPTELSAPTPMPPAAAPTPADVSPALARDIEECRAAMPAVRILGPKADKKLTLVFTFAEGPVQRVRLVLRDLEDYPDIPPLVDECKISPFGGEEKLITLGLNALANWGERSRLLDVVQEVLARQPNLRA